MGSPVEMRALQQTVHRQTVYRWVHLKKAMGGGEERIGNVNNKLLNIIKSDTSVYTEIRRKAAI